MNFVRILSGENETSRINSSNSMKWHGVAGIRLEDFSIFVLCTQPKKPAFSQAGPDWLYRSLLRDAIEVILFEWLPRVVTDLRPRWRFSPVQECSIAPSRYFEH